MRNLLFGILGMMVIACASKVANTPSSSAKYSEDLSSLRKIELPPDTLSQKPGSTTAPKDTKTFVEAHHAINSQLDAVLDSINRINLSTGVVDGFTIQLYSGVNRDEALNAKKQVATAMPELDSEMQFVQPNFRVRAGKYFTRLEAQKDFMAVKRFFPSAILIPERIPFK